MTNYSFHQRQSLTEKVREAKAKRQSVLATVRMRRAASRRGFRQPSPLAYRMMKAPSSLQQPHLRLDNIALMPASLLPFKAVWEDIMRDLGEGEVLLIVPTARAVVRQACEQLGRSFLTAGYSVTTISAERFRAYCQTYPDGP